MIVLGLACLHLAINGIANENQYFFFPLLDLLFSDEGMGCSPAPFGSAWVWAGYATIYISTLELRVAFRGQ